MRSNPPKEVQVAQASKGSSEFGTSFAKAFAKGFGRGLGEGAARALLGRD